MPLAMLNFVFMVVFLFFAYRKFLVPEAWLLVSIYLVAAFSCGLVVMQFYFPLLYLGAMAFYLGYAGLLFFVRNGVLDWIRKYRMPGIFRHHEEEPPCIDPVRKFIALMVITGVFAMDYLTLVGLRLP